MNRRILTLCLVYKNSQVLLGMKKRGFGMGKWNGFGGKVEKGESIEDAVKRELFEESELTANSVEKIGTLDFTWKGRDEVLEVNIFKTTDFSGDPKETEEMRPEWFDVSNIPFGKMWPDDKYWFPLFLAGKKFGGKFVFDQDNNILEHQLHER